MATGSSLAGPPILQADQGLCFDGSYPFSLIAVNGVMAHFSTLKEKVSNIGFCKFKSPKKNPKLSREPEEKVSWLSEEFGGFCS